MKRPASSRGRPRRIEIADSIRRAPCSPCMIVRLISISGSSDAPSRVTCWSIWSPTATAKRSWRAHPGSASCGRPCSRRRACATSVRFQSTASTSGPPWHARLLGVDQRAGDLAEQPVFGRARIFSNPLRVLVGFQGHSSIVPVRSRRVSGTTSAPCSRRPPSHRG